MTRVMVTGGREFDDVPALFATLDKIHKETPISMIIHGACKRKKRSGGLISADMIADAWAKWRGVPVDPYPVTDEEWARYGYAAGPMRNTRMVNRSCAEICVVAPGGSGTADCSGKARRAGMRMVEVPR